MRVPLKTARFFSMTRIMTIIFDENWKSFFFQCKILDKSKNKHSQSIQRKNSARRKWSQNFCTTKIWKVTAIFMFFAKIKIFLRLWKIWLFVKNRKIAVTFHIFILEKFWDHFLRVKFLRWIDYACLFFNLSSIWYWKSWFSIFHSQELCFQKKPDTRGEFLLSNFF